jgi:phosphate butyryltransferase
MNSKIERLLTELMSDGKRVRSGIYIAENGQRLIPVIQDGINKGWLNPIFIGETDHVKAVAHNFEESKYESIIVSNDVEAFDAISSLIKDEKIDMLLLGYATAEESLQNIKPLCDNKTLVGVSICHPENLDRPLMISDVSIHSEPDINSRELIVQRSIDVAKRIGIKTPRVAMLAAVEVANPGLPVTVECEDVAKRFDAVEGVYVQGPLSMDLAISEHAALKKGAKGEVPGKADILVGPNMTVSRGVYQALVSLCGESAGTVITGGRVPVAVPGRTTGQDGVLISTLFAAVIS